MSENPNLGPDPVSDMPKVKKGANVWVTSLTVLGIGAILVFLMMPARRTSREAARRSQCKHNLKQIGLALHSYKDAYDVFPPAYTVDASGKPLHSWRTLILPYLDQQKLYKKIDLSKAWDDPANAEARKTAIGAYQCPSAILPEYHTTYLAIVTSNSCFRRTEPRRLSEITDDPGGTLMVIEVDMEHSIHWMSPLDADEPLVMSIGADSKMSHNGGSHAAFVDGHVRFLSTAMRADDRRALISIAAGDKVGDF